MSANIAMPRSLDTWPTVAAPRAEDAGSDGGQAIVLLGAGPFQDLPHRLAMIDLRYEKQCVTDTTSSVFGGFGNERVRDALHLLDPVLGSSNFISLVLPFLFLASLRENFPLPPCPTLLAPCGK